MSHNDNQNGLVQKCGHEYGSVRVITQFDGRPINGIHNEINKLFEKVINEFAQLNTQCYDAENTKREKFYPFEYTEISVMPYLFCSFQRADSDAVVFPQDLITKSDKRRRVDSREHQGWVDIWFRTKTKTTSRSRKLLLVIEIKHSSPRYASLKEGEDTPGYLKRLWKQAHAKFNKVVAPETKEMWRRQADYVYEVVMLSVPFELCEQVTSSDEAIKKVGLDLGKYLRGKNWRKNAPKFIAVWQLHPEKTTGKLNDDGTQESWGSVIFFAHLNRLKP